jgi:hypothetical protein
MAFNIGGYTYSGPMASSQLNKKLGTIPSLPATSAAAIMSANSDAKDGFYYIKFGTFGVKRVYCIMNSSINGGGWMGVTSDMCPQVDNSQTSITWESNTSSNKLQKGNPQILNVSLVETGCGGTSFYKLKNPNDYGFSYTSTMLLMERVTTIGQCSGISGGGSSGWYSGPIYSGSFTAAGMCTWDDLVFANNCCGAQNMSGLKTWWVMFGGGTNPDLRYKVECAGGTGQHYHMWFIK